MTLKQTVEFLMLVSAYYPNWKPDVDKELIAKAWHHDLQGHSLDDVNAAFAIYRAQGNQFPPSQPGVLLSLLVDAADDSLNESEAWALVDNARHNGIYGAQKEFDALPEDVQKAVGSPSQLTQWALASPDSASVIQSNFQRAYRAVLERKKQNAMLPASVRERLNGAMEMHRLQG